MITNVVLCDWHHIVIISPAWLVSGQANFKTRKRMQGCVPSYSLIVYSLLVEYMFCFVLFFFGGGVDAQIVCIWQRSAMWRYKKKCNISNIKDGNTAPIRYEWKRVALEEANERGLGLYNHYGREMLNPKKTHLSNCTFKTKRYALVTVRFPFV